MSRERKISILTVLVGVLLPVASLGFAEGYNPRGGFIYSLSRMEIAIRGDLGAFYGQSGVLAIPYSYVLAFSCWMVCLYVFSENGTFRRPG